MKVLKLPITDNIINCSCGCKFEFDASDTEAIVMYDFRYTLTRVVVDCPLCRKRHVLMTLRDDVEIPGANGL